MKTFTLFSTKEFNDTAKVLGLTKKQRQETIQKLATHAVYMQAYNGKADFANNLIRNVQKHYPRDAKHVRAYLLFYCDNLRSVTKADKDQGKAFFTKKGVKPHASIEEAESAGLDAISSLDNWDTWQAPESAKPESFEDGVDFNKPLESLVNRCESKGVKADQSKQFAALQSFISLIREGKTLADVRAEFDVKLAGVRTEIIQEVNSEKKTGTHG